MFAKVFGQIFDSSISTDYVTRHVFIDILILADKDGVVDMTPEAISRRTNVPIEIVESAIEKLCQPDPRSRSYKEDGRRLSLLDEHRDWGWQIVNYQHYREMKDEEGRRAYFREYARERRAKQKVVKDKSLTKVSVNPRYVSVSQLVSVSLFEELWKIWPRKDSGKSKTKSKFEQLAKADKPDLILERAKAQVAIWNQEGKEKQFIPMLSTWLHQKRYDTEPELFGGTNSNGKAKGLSGVFEAYAAANGELAGGSDKS